ncbi:MAG: hypothetical protein A2987_04090 [Omnitrophica bacterium RIFCSPLOWO2_01_FULL_45_10]|nr:MAG: hypothetical protein A2987_04090 [Omnitrophica bacterium RIFCSPLOWO2_01_FULL_45_10]
MKEIKYDEFADDLETRVETPKPLNAQIELTYRCNLGCIHCYCKGVENKDKELSASRWKKILDDIYNEECFWITLTGGEPFLHDDFLEIYAYARRKGFLINIFTNGIELSPEIFKYLKRYPPFQIEISLYGVTEGVYESISQVPGSYEKAMANINSLLKIKMPLILKTIGLKENKTEILKIKAFSEKLLGKNKFRFDPLILPRLNGDRSPYDHRLSPREILEIERSDKEMIKHREKQFDKPVSSERARRYLYRCNAWWITIYINPYGRLQFCSLSKKFSVDLTKRGFSKDLYKEFAKLLNEKLKTDSKCKFCGLRDTCYCCPARAFLETGDEESVSDYHCQLVKMQMNMFCAGKRRVYRPVDNFEKSYTVNRLQRVIQ